MTNKHKYLLHLKSTLLNIILFTTKQTHSACATNQYTDPNNNNLCQVCPPGFECDGSATITPCQDGQYWTPKVSGGSGDVNCHDCSAGFYCPDKSSVSQIICPLGTYSGSKQTECTACEAGNFCDSSTSTPCASGTYSSLYSTDCTPCPAGYECNSDGSTLTLCAIGTYSLTGESTCTDCQDGTRCPNSYSGNEVPCPKNYYSDKSTASCKACPAGKFCDTTIGSCGSESECQDCSTNQFSFSGGPCIDCPSGYSCKDFQPPVKCPNGQYPKDDGTCDCTACSVGYYCPPLTAVEVICPQGYQSEDNSPGAVTCEICEDGFNCEDPTNKIDCSTVGGHFCSGGFQHECPLGTYRSNSGDAKSVHDCTTCEAGKCCDVVGMSSPNPCTAGFFCPEGTVDCEENPCPAGTFNTNTNLQSATDCTECSPGNYCPGGEITSQTTCPLGYYCVAGQIGAFEHPCPGGTYGSSTGLSLASQCTDCDEGYYCPQGSTQQFECPAGTYNEKKNMPDIINCLPCEKGFACDNIPISDVTVSDQRSKCQPGYYCPQGTKSPDQFPCPAGTFSDSDSLTDASECTPCTAGFYCNFGSTTNIMNQFPCREGYYCPQGSVAEIACPAGFYNDLIEKSALSDCKDCQAGYFCDIASATDNLDSQICPNGYYCELNTKSNDQYPCPAGTYNLLTGRTSLVDCLPCPQGHFCEKGTGEVYPKSVDPSVFYYPSNVNASLIAAGVPCPLGTYRSTTGATTESDCDPCPAGQFCNVLSGTITPIDCDPGYYSEIGSYECKICEQGRFCPSSGTTDTAMESNQCQAGYYCDFGSQVNTGLDTKLCAKGYYCEQGTKAMAACPPGTFNDQEQQTSLSNCQPCTAGYFCEQAMIAPPEDDMYGQRFVCSKGHYCPTSITVDGSSQYHPAMGFPSVIGSTGPEEVACPSGTYLDETKGTDITSCKNCRAGFFCLEGATEETTCPAGHYCPAGDRDNASSEGNISPRPCLPGSFSDQVGLQAATDCTICTLGTFCNTEGLTTPSGLCDPGYICYNGSNTSQPIITMENRDGDPMGEICPVGGYCLSGSYKSTPCPPKTFNNQEGQLDESNCQFCNAGNYCPPNTDSTGLDTEGLPCPAGYYCPQESYYVLPCGAGNYCPESSAAPIKCPVGTYQQSDISGTCDPCPPGQVCSSEGMDRTEVCPAGSYCPQYSSSSTGDELAVYNSNKANYINITDSEGTFGTSDPSGSLCPAGTFQPFVEQYDFSHCLACDKGHYCANIGDSDQTGLCLKGYVCFSSAVSPTPNDNTTGRPCEPGNYCTQDSILDLMCPSGTYRPQTLGNDESDCLPCDNGKYCPNAGEVSADNTCDDGYYCENTSTIGANTPHQNRCPIGTECQSGQKTTCSSTTYQDYPGTNTCKTCPDGKLCPQSDVDCTVDGNCVLDCPNDYYCQAGIQTKCPNGYYNLATGLEQEAQCAACPGGKYCESGNDPTNAKVLKGYYSSGGSVSSTPQDLSNCNACADATSCAAACPDALGTNPNNCNICGPCEPGYFCPEESTDYKSNPCPAGQYGLTNRHYEELSDCQNCPAGKYCPTEATSANNAAALQDCDEGYICSGSCSEPNPSSNQSNSCGYICPIMHKCPAGATSEILCNDKEEAPEGSGACSPCEDGFTCTVNGNTIDKVPCLPGGYCEAGDRTDCDAGTFSNQSGAYNEDFCQPCPAGYYCPIGTSDYTANPCQSGHYCPEGTSQMDTSNQCVKATTGNTGTCCDSGFEKTCPDGFYCTDDELDCNNLVGTYECPAGSYCKDGKKISCESGAYCPAGSSIPSYCGAGNYSVSSDESDSVACQPCPAGTFCPTGSNNVDNICHEGYYCEAGSSTPQQNKCEAGSFCSQGLKESCLVGTFQSDTTSSSCLRGIFRGKRNSEKLKTKKNF